MRRCLPLTVAALSGCPTPPSIWIERLEDGAWRDAGAPGRELRSAAVELP